MFEINSAVPLFISIQFKNTIENIIISRRFMEWNTYLKMIMDRRRTIGKLNLEPRIEFGHCLGTWTAIMDLFMSNGTINVLWRNLDVKYACIFLFKIFNKLIFQ
ncbi:hypothetical protein DERF_001752 [Dermatophagoides farinae]|uniref:Uncharacterized protein n=2 Tax=Dermatophagoides farinae TaxID=6954 RepID=A0A922IBI2_DERFA|nr:hypothetical protein DERF_001752 [Dermatophagoides farinae]